MINVCSVRSMKNKPLCIAYSVKNHMKIINVINAMNKTIIRIIMANAWVARMMLMLIAKYVSWLIVIHFGVANVKMDTI